MLLAALSSIVVAFCSAPLISSGLLLSLIFIVFVLSSVFTCPCSAFLFVSNDTVSLWCKVGTSPFCCLEELFNCWMGVLEAFFCWERFVISCIWEGGIIIFVKFIGGARDSFTSCFWFIDSGWPVLNVTRKSPSLELFWLTNNFCGDTIGSGFDPFTGDVEVFVLSSCIAKSFSGHSDRVQLITGCFPLLSILILSLKWSGIELIESLVLNESVLPPKLAFSELFSLISVVSWPGFFNISPLPMWNSDESTRTFRPLSAKELVSLNSSTGSMVCSPSFLFSVVVFISWCTLGSWGCEP